MKKNLILKNIVICLIFAGAYFVLSLPFSSQVFENAAAELRFSDFLPMVAGVMFGPVGAVGCALGDVMLNIGTASWLSNMVGTVGVFLMGYVSYKLWHSLFLSKDGKSVMLDSVAFLLKYTLIALIASVCAAGATAVSGQLFHLFNFEGFFREVALQYFDFSIMGGLLLVQVLIKYTNIKPYIPKKVYERQYVPARYVIDHILWVSATVLSLVLMALMEPGDVQGTAVVDALCVVLMIVIALLTLLPIARSKKPAEAIRGHSPVGGIQGQFMTGFLVLLCAVLLFYTGSMIRHIAHDSNSELWVEVLASVAVAAVVMVGFLALLLKWIETHVSEPICRITAYAEHFVCKTSLAEDDFVLMKTGNEMDVLGASITQMTDDIRGYVAQIKERTVIEERLIAEMNVAHDIQTSLLPEKWKGEEADIAALIKPARRVGGDFYDVCALSGHRIFLAIADVSGKGMAAALFMVCAKTLMKERLDLPVSEMMRQLNDELAEQNESMMFVTAFACLVDLDAMTLTYTNAGHNPPVIYNDKAYALLEQQPDFVVGPVVGTTYREHTMPIARDFKLLLYTDGVTEAQNGKDEFFGEERLLQTAGDVFSADMTAQLMVEELEKRVEHFVDGAEQSDDITLLCLSLNRD